MAMYGLFLKTQRCPDGVHLVPPPAIYEGTKPGLYFRGRTDRREPLRLTLDSLESPVVIDFVNARDDDRRVEFFAKFGPLLYEGERPHPVPAHGSEYSFVADFQRILLDMLRKVSGANQVDALEAINSSLMGVQEIGLRPAFDLSGEGGNPRMLLQCNDLLHFMTMEVAMVALQGAKLSTCEHCGDVFLTGHLTGRRSTAKYCSDKCRVAAMRIRNAAKR